MKPAPGLPAKGTVRRFIFATGIENSYPTIALPDGRIIRVDEMQKAGHYEHWREDFRLTQELGIQYLRYGPPYYSTYVGPGHYDWSFADETFNALREMNIEPIADLCHFGVPNWVGDFQNPDWPALHAQYARAFVRHFPWVRLYTPVNEIMIAARNSAQAGYWNERLKGERPFVSALKHLCRANLLAMHEMLKENSRLVFIQSEATQDFHAGSPDAMPAATFLNEKRFLALDLTYGVPISAHLYEYLLDHGMTREEYHWFLTHHLREHCIMGNDYYASNEYMVHPDGQTSDAGEIFGYYVITRQYYERYRLPVMHTETNCLGAAVDATQWLLKEWQSLHRLKLDGVPIVGFTWYSLTDQVDWNSTLRKDAGHVDPVGLCDLDRRLRPVGHAYRELIAKWGEIRPAENLQLMFHAEEP